MNEGDWDFLNKMINEYEDSDDADHEARVSHLFIFLNTCRMKYEATKTSQLKSVEVYSDQKDVQNCVQ